jgi:hypothetical protein
VRESTFLRLALAAPLIVGGVVVGLSSLLPFRIGNMRIWVLLATAAYVPFAIAWLVWSRHRSLPRLREAFRVSPMLFGLMLIAVWFFNPVVWLGPALVRPLDFLRVVAIAVAGVAAAIVLPGYLYVLGVNRLVPVLRNKGVIQPAAEDGV